MKYADIHCHPHARAFHWMRHTKNETKHTGRYHAWNVVLSNFKKQGKGKRAFSYSQCDPVKLLNSETKLVYVSLYPFEKGFFQGGEIDQNKLINTLDMMATFSLGYLFNPLKWFKAAFTFITGAPTILTTSRVFFQSLLMRMPIRRIKYFASSEYDYYHELLKERDFLLKQNDVETRNRIYISGLRKLYKNPVKLRKKYPESLDANGKYVVCKNFTDVESTINRDEIAMILTIEGMHALSTDTSPEKLDERIREIKNWPTPVLFITFAHHFNNFLCGHAHSIHDSLKIIMNQDEGMNESFTNAGERAVKQLLSLDDQLNYQPSLGQRILIDLKHTSALSRKWYYENIISKCLENEDSIPVILSHVGYSGWRTLDESISYAPEENDTELVGGFYPWNINACGEDAVWVAKTKGLIGLNFDQRILGDNDDKINSIDLIVRNLLAMIDRILDHPDISVENKKDCWSLFSIGTDFEGYIDPTQDYSNALEFPDFEKDLKKKLTALSETDGERYFLENAERVDEVVDAICFTNAFNFLKRNF